MTKRWTRFQFSFPLKYHWNRTYLLVFTCAIQSECKRKTKIPIPLWALDIESLHKYNTNWSMSSAIFFLSFLFFWSPAGALTWDLLMHYTIFNVHLLQFTLVRSNVNRDYNSSVTTGFSIHDIICIRSTESQDLCAMLLRFKKKPKKWRKVRNQTDAS